MSSATKAAPKFDWDKLNELLNEQKRPVNSFTLQEYYQNLKIPKTTACRRLKKGLTTGKLTKVTIAHKDYYLVKETSR